MLRITVKFQQQQFNVESMGSRKIQEFIERLINQLKLAPGTIYGLFMQNTQLQNAQSFVENRVQSGAVLELKPVKQVNFGFVKVMNNNTPNFMHTDLDEQCEKLYNEVAAKISKPMNSFTLEFNGRILEKQRPLKDYGIVSNSIINVVYQSYSGGQVNSNAQLTVRIYYSNQYFTLPVPGQTLILQIEQTIKQKFNLTQEVYLTTQDNQRLQSQQPISSYNLPENAQLNVNVQNQQQQYNQQSAPIQSYQQNPPMQSYQQSAPIPQSSAQVQQYPPSNQPQQGGSREIILLIEYQGTVQNTQMDNSILVSELEAAMQEAFQITQPVQMIFNGSPLISNQTLAQQGLQKGSRLTLQIKPQQPASVPQQPKQSSSEQPLRFYTPPQNLVHYGPPRKLIILLEYQGQVSNSEVQSDTLVSELEDAMKEAYGISQPVQLIFENQVLPPNQNLDQLGIQKGSRFIVQIKPQQQPINQPPQQVQNPQQSYGGQPRKLIILIEYQGQVSNSEVQSDTLVSELEEAMRDAYGITQPVQLMFNNQALPSNQNLDQLGIQKGSRFILQIKPQQQPMNQPPQQVLNTQYGGQPRKLIILIEYQGQVSNSEVQSDTLVSELEEAMREAYGLSQPVQLILNNEPLPSNQTLDQLGIQKGTRLILQIKPQQQLTTQPAQQIFQTQQSYRGPPRQLTLLIEYQGSISNIQIEGTTTIRELEDAMQEAHGLTQPIQLLFEGKILPSDQTLDQLGLAKGSRLNIQIKQQIPPQQQVTQTQQVMQSQVTSVQVNIEYGTFQLQAQLQTDTSIQELEKSFEQELQIYEPVGLMFNGQLLNSNQTLQQVGIKQGSTLVVQKKSQLQQTQLQTSSQPIPQLPTKLTLLLDYNGQVFNVELPRDTLISEIEDSMKEQLGLKQGVQILQDTVTLASNQTLQQLNIQKGTKLKIQAATQPPPPQSSQQTWPPQQPQQTRPPQQGKQIILLIEHQGQVHNIEVEDTTQVSELETLLQESFGVQGKIILINNGKPLNSNQTFQQQNVLKGTRLQISTAPPQFAPKPFQPTQPVPFQQALLQNQQQPPFQNFQPQKQQVPFQQSTQFQNPPFQQPPQQFPPKPQAQSLELSLKIDINGQLQELSLESNTLVSELEALLKDSFQITQQFGIYYQGQQLQSNMSFLQLRVPNDAKLEVKFIAQQVQQQGNTIPIRIQSEGQTISAEIDLVTHISELQETLQEQLGLPQKCILSCNGQALQPQMTIQQLNLKPNDLLILTQQTNTNEIELIVSVQGEDIEMDVNSDSLVYELMDLIKQEKQLYMPTELVYQGRVLLPQQTFRSQNVPDGAYLMLRKVEKVSGSARIKSNK